MQSTQLKQQRGAKHFARQYIDNTIQSKPRTIMRRFVNGPSDDGEKENIDSIKSLKRSATFGHHVKPHIDLDEERAACMRRNQQKLQELGLAPLIQSMKSTAAMAAEAKKAAALKKRRIDGSCSKSMGQERVLRRSLRTRGQEPELPPLLAPFFNRSQAERPYGEPGTMLPAAKPRAPGSARCRTRRC
ncbi:hypothetical protein Vretifemale_13905 [Volvox reticuliferus]|uniref:Uncharacterized protein n=1 Tax=Volvox reticuliferus TaxID=1737510 RepID=A0A8J4FSK1_9CHLO|nr:hypothetical protein Vretifemale_13905 [Volvox reticuliferus]